MKNKKINYRIRLLKHNLVSLINEYPHLIFPLKRLFSSNPNLIVNSNTDIVIDGYPRSANTFAVEAFLLSQGRECNIAHHTHIPAQIIKAVKLQIPTMVLIRDPMDAVSSRAIFSPFIPIDVALQDYINYYQVVLRNIDNIELALFEEVINNYGSVIKRINFKFNTEFNLYENNSENKKRVFERIERNNRMWSGKEKISENTVARPSVERKQKKVEVMDELKKQQEKLEVARNLYEILISTFISSI